MGLARMLLPGVPLGRPDTTGWRGSLFKARPWKVKGLDLVVNRSRVTREQLWALDVVVSAEALLDVSEGAARAGLDWNAC